MLGRFPTLLEMLSGLRFLHNKPFGHRLLIPLLACCFDAREPNSLGSMVVGIARRVGDPGCAHTIFLLNAETSEVY